MFLQVWLLLSIMDSFLMVPFFLEVKSKYGRYLFYWRRTVAVFVSLLILLFWSPVSDSILYRLIFYSSMVLVNSILSLEGESLSSLMHFWDRCTWRSFSRLLYSLLVLLLLFIVNSFMISFLECIEYSLRSLDDLIWHFCSEFLIYCFFDYYFPSVLCLWGIFYNPLSIFFGLWSLWLSPPLFLDSTKLWCSELLLIFPCSKSILFFRFSIVCFEIFFLERWNCDPELNIRFKDLHSIA